MLARERHEIKFLCQHHHDREMEGVDIILLKGKLGADVKTESTGYRKTIEVSLQFQKGMEVLKKKGYYPDVVISHSGWGCGLNSSIVWPKAKRIAYLEWWFEQSSDFYNFGPLNKWWNKEFSMNDRFRNLPLALELSECDRIISPTEWQKSQLPKGLLNNCEVIPDGVNVTRFSPPDKEGKEIKNNIKLTYGTRGMEAMRGFGEFIEELDQVLEENPKLIVEIAGSDRICYAGYPPKSYKSFKAWADVKIGHWIAEGRVTFVGTLEMDSYRKWLQMSDIHVYLTRPFVASWSLLEAMASGCCIIASDTKPVLEFLSDNEAILVDYTEPGWLKASIGRLIGDNKLRSKLSKNARSKSLMYSADKSIKAWNSFIMKL